jgi:DNA-binding transcriptional ArsR family regulator
MYDFAMSTVHHPALEELEIERILQALGDLERLKIVLAIAESDGPMQCGSFPTQLSKSTMSHHFRVLREAGLTHTQRIGQKHFVTLRREELDCRFPGLLDAVFSHFRGRDFAPPE